MHQRINEKSEGMIRTVLLTGMILALILAAVPLSIADEYRWIKNDAEDDEHQIIPVDPKICKLYEENLQYFARKNTPLSCYRPIAPHLNDRIKEVEWEDLDPDRYPALFRSVVIEDRHLSKKGEDVIQESLKYDRENVAKKISVFRRAKLPPLIGRIRVSNHSAKPEPYWIVQYGPNDVSESNPRKASRCIPTRDGGRESSLHLYVVSETKQEVTKTLSYTRYPTREGQYLRLIDGRLFVENIRPGWISLDEVEIETAFRDQVCNFRFKKHPE
jgi:hypothetical protein